MNPPDYISVAELYSYWDESKYWNTVRQDMMPAIRKTVREFRDENKEFGQHRRKQYLEDRKKTLTAEILLISDRIESLSIPEWEKSWLMESTKPLNRQIKKINGELRYVYGTPKGHICDEDVRRAREVDIMGLDLIQGAKRSGQGRYVASCLFHDEKTASMTIYPAGRGFHCFGCQKSGDTIDIVMKVLNLNFVQAIKYLRGK